MRCRQHNFETNIRKEMQHHKDTVPHEHQMGGKICSECGTYLESVTHVGVGSHPTRIAVKCDACKRKDYEDYKAKLDAEEKAAKEKAAKEAATQ